MVGRVEIGFAVDRKGKRQNGKPELVDLLLIQVAAAVGHDNIVTHGVPFRAADKRPLLGNRVDSSLEWQYCSRTLR